MNPREFEKSQVARLAVSQWKVLLALAYDGQENPYQVANKYRMAYPVVHRAVKVLKGLGWIRVMRREKNIKNANTYIYGMTDKGLLWFFSRLPKETPHKWIEGLWEKDTSSNQERKEAPYPEDLKASEDISSLVGRITTDEDVHKHLLFDLDVDRIAENTKLFPAVLGTWEIHKKAAMSGSITSFLPELAFSTLSECRYGYEGLLEKYGTIDQIFAYKVYRKIIENEARIALEMNLVSEEEHVERVWRWVNDVSATVPQFFAMYKDIVLDLKKRFAESLSFTEKMASRVSSSAAEDTPSTGSKKP